MLRLRKAYESNPYEAEQLLKVGTTCSSILNIHHSTFAFVLFLPRMFSNCYKLFKLHWKLPGLKNNLHIWSSLAWIQKYCFLCRSVISTLWLVSWSSSCVTCPSVSSPQLHTTGSSRPTPSRTKSSGNTISHSIHYEKDDIPGVEISDSSAFFCSKIFQLWNIIIFLLSLKISRFC